MKINQRLKILPIYCLITIILVQPVALNAASGWGRKPKWITQQPTDPAYYHGIGIIEKDSNTAQDYRTAARDMAQTEALDERKEFNLKLITYAGSIQEEIDRLTRYRNLSLGSAGGLGLLAAVMKVLSTSSYDEYQAATNPADIETLYGRANGLNKGSVVAAGLAVAAVVPVLRFQWDIGKLRTKLQP